MHHMQIWKEVRSRKIRGQTVLTLVRAWTGTIGLELAVKMGVVCRPEVQQDGNQQGDARRPAIAMLGATLVNLPAWRQEGRRWRRLAGGQEAAARKPSRRAKRMMRRERWL